MKEKRKTEKTKKHRWSKEEDAILLNQVEIHGANRWQLISKAIKGRKGKQCRERWQNHLNPSISKKNWSRKEEWLLFLLYQYHGSKWSQIQSYLHNRSDNAIKNHWNSIMRRKYQGFQEILRNYLRKDKENLSEEEMLCKLIERTLTKTTKKNQQKILLTSLEEFDSFIQQDSVNSLENSIIVQSCKLDSEEIVQPINTYLSLEEQTQEMQQQLGQYQEESANTKQNLYNMETHFRFGSKQSIFEIMKKNNRKFLSKDSIQNFPCTLNSIKNLQQIAQDSLIKLQSLQCQNLTRHFLVF